MNYIGIRLFSEEPISPLEKKAYIRKLYKDQKTAHKKENINIGFFEKFSHALGYKGKREYNVDYLDFLTPADILSENFYSYPFGNIIGDFYVTDTETVSVKGKYSFNNKEVALKWKKFLQKVFPSLSVTTFTTDSLPNRETWLQSHVFTCIEDYPVSIECSIDSPITEEEINSVRKVIELFYSDDMYYRVHSFHCRTCEGYNANRPYHFEVDYHYSNKGLKKIRSEYDLEQKEPTCFNCLNKVEETENVCSECEEILKSRTVFTM